MSNLREDQLKTTIEIGGTVAPFSKVQISLSELYLPLPHDKE